MAKAPTKEPPEAPRPNPSEPTRTEVLQVEELRERVEQTVGPVVAGAQRAQIVDRVTTLIAAEVFRGPLPHPRHLRGYEDVCPGAADRIIAMAEEAQQRREDRDDMLLESDVSDRKLGMVFGFAALVLVLVIGAGLVFAGHTAVGAALLSVAVLGSVASLFVNGRPMPVPTKEKSGKPGS